MARAFLQPTGATRLSARTGTGCNWPREVRACGTVGASCLFDGARAGTMLMPNAVWRALVPGGVLITAGVCR